MRLLRRRSDGRLVFSEWIGKENPPPPYAILSHTWATDNSQEVTFQDVEAGFGKAKSGWQKIDFCAEMAAADGLKYFWIDTCCIDKRDAVELTTAINSMFRWFQDAAKCYVFLSDVSTTRRKGHKDSGKSWERSFQTSRWFSRGWTLQELIAPTNVEFFSAQRKYLGSKTTLEPLIHKVTAIPRSALKGHSLTKFSIRERRSWARNRNTKLEEDSVYCLLGLLNVSLPLIYGEGKEQAWRRLDKELDSSEVVDPILEWLSPVDFSMTQRELIARRQENTGAWFFGSSVFRRWLNGHSKTLFCPGIPGAGKTMIAAMVVDRICRTTSDDVGVAYLFCSHTARFDQSAQALLAAALKQLISSRPDLCTPETTINNIYETYQTRGIRPSLDDTIEAMQSVCAGFQRVYIVVDALDECADNDGMRNTLVRSLRCIQEGGNTQILCTSRPTPSIERLFRDDPVLRIRAQKEDVMRFVVGQTSRFADCIVRDEGLTKDVQVAIVEASGEMFLLARLHVESFLDRRTKASVKSHLKELTRGGAALDYAYKEAMKRIQDQSEHDRMLAKRALAWISYAQRPFTPVELCHALAIEAGADALDEDAVYEIHDILNVCAGLVTIDEESGVVRLVHYTTQVYIEEIRSAWNLDEELAIACLTYLSFNAFRSGDCPSKGHLHRRHLDYPLFSYFATSLGTHVRHVEQRTAVFNALAALVYDEALVCAFFQIRATSYICYASDPSGRRPTALHLAARTGLPYLTQSILAEMSRGTQAIDINAWDNYEGTALRVAVRFNYEAVARILLECGASVELETYHGCPELLLAVENREEAMARLLIRHGAGDERMYGLRNTPLMTAVNNEDITMAQALLELGAGTELKDLFGDTALLMAAQLSDHSMVTLLLQHGAAVDEKDRYGNTSLLRAVWNRNLPAATALLERGADVNMKGGEGLTAADIASKTGESAMLELLQNYGGRLDQASHELPTR